LHRAGPGKCEFLRHQWLRLGAPTRDAAFAPRCCLVVGPRLRAAKSTGSRDTLCACRRPSQVPRRRGAHRAGVTCGFAGSSHVLRPEGTRPSAPDGRLFAAHVSARRSGDGETGVCEGRLGSSTWPSARIPRSCPGDAGAQHARKSLRLVSSSSRWGWPAQWVRERASSMQRFAVHAGNPAGSNLGRHGTSLA
jgi:hypothetical protein